jgi:Rod binding domain-containing protein
VDAKVHKAAQDFEAMFVRQILSAAKVGGNHAKQSGYDGMAVDAIAGAVSQGGGLGLAQHIEDALARAGIGAQKK